MALTQDCEGGHERRQVLARLERRDREHVRAAQVGRLALGREARVDPGIGDAHPLLGDAEPLHHVPGGEARVGEDPVAGRARRSRTSARAGAASRARPTPGSAAARGRGSSSPAAPRRCAGYIQSEKWKTSSRPTSRSTVGRPRRLQAVRSACGISGVRTSTSSPASASSIRSRPRGPDGPNATSSCSPPAASASPATMPRM